MRVIPPPTQAIDVKDKSLMDPVWYRFFSETFRQVSANSYLVANLPSPATAGQIIFVSNESGGAVLAFSDGTNWRRVTDRAIVS